MTPRETAARAGQPRFRGNACKACGSRVRYTSSGSCVACSRRRAGETTNEIRALLKGAKEEA